jgi:hypothetical protein
MIDSNDFNRLGGNASPDGIQSPWLGRVSSSDLPYSFPLRCEVAEMPGRTIATSDETAYGPTSKRAYETTYSDITIQIIASEDMRERALFDLWMDQIVKGSNYRGVNNSGPAGALGGAGGVVGYYDDYSKGLMSINQMNDSGAVLMTTTMIDCFPIGMSAMNMTWEESNTYQRFSVTMSYRYHRVSYITDIIND